MYILNSLNCLSENREVFGFFTACYICGFRFWMNHQAAIFKCHKLQYILTNLTNKHKNRQHVLELPDKFEHSANKCSWDIRIFAKMTITCENIVNLFFLPWVMLSPELTYQYAPPLERRLANGSRVSVTRGAELGTSLGFSTIEKHWRIQSSHRFYGVYFSKMEKTMCLWYL